LCMELSLSSPLSFQYSLYILVTSGSLRFSAMATPTVVLSSENSL
jgi:hypothetical protein